MIYLELFWTFFKIGVFTFGGGYAMLPLIQSEVLSKGWLTSQELINFIAVSESTPGAFAINIATYIGSQTGGIFGSFCATAGVVLPSFIIILIVAKFFEKFKKSKTIEGMMNGLRPCAVGLIGAAVISLGKEVFFSKGFTFSLFKDYFFLCTLAIFALSLFLAFFKIKKKKIHPILIIVISAVLGIATGYINELI
ncbi:MAG: chromate transporter [Clostridiales bacterium]|nr:chromate transporter [Clostridiales bacterium]